MPDEHGAADPAQAFEDLRAEVSVLRKAIEALPGALRESRAPDYSEDLGVIGKGLDEIGGQLETLQKHPALRMTPEQHGHAIANAGSGLIREAAQKLDRAAADIERERSYLAAMIGQAHTQDRQLRIVCWTAGVALAAGLALSPFIAGMLPFGLNTRIAALVMMTDRWHAGEALMQTGNPTGWAEQLANINLVNANLETISLCRDAAKKAKKVQRCILRVSAD